MPMVRPMPGPRPLLSKLGHLAIQLGFANSIRAFSLWEEAVEPGERSPVGRRDAISPAQSQQSGSVLSGDVCLTFVPADSAEIAFRTLDDAKMK